METDVREQLLSAQETLVAVVKDAAASDTKLSEAYGTLGQIYQAYSLLYSARECYLNATVLTPKDFRWIYLLAKIDQQEGRTDEAISRLRVARVIQPDYVAAAVNLGNIYLESNRLSEAEEAYQAALARDPNDPAANYGLGQVALSKRNYAAAVSYLEKALALTPNANRIHYGLFLAYRGLGETEKASAHVAQQGTVGVRVADPLVDGLQQIIKGERLHLVRGRQALEAKSYAEAASEFQKAIAANPDSVTARVNLGTVLAQVGDSAGAIAQFEETLRRSPENTTAHYNLAVLLSGQGKHAEAIDHLRSVLRIDSNDLSSRFFVAQELKTLGRLDDALTEFSRVVRADPANEEALLEEVNLLLKKKQYKDALEALEKGHAQFPQKGRTAVMLAYLLAASPENELRNGARALELAQLVYRSTGLVNHGEVVALALAELNRCEEAAAWVRLLLGKASGDDKSSLVEKLKAEISRYETARPCRPAGELILLDQHGRVRAGKAASNSPRSL